MGGSNENLALLFQNYVESENKEETMQQIKLFLQGGFSPTSQVVLQEKKTTLLELASRSDDLLDAICSSSPYIVIDDYIGHDSIAKNEMRTEVEVHSSSGKDEEEIAIVKEEEIQNEDRSSNAKGDYDDNHSLPSDDSDSYHCYDEDTESSFHLNHLFTSELTVNINEDDKSESTLPEFETLADDRRDNDESESSLPKNVTIADDNNNNIKSCIINLENETVPFAENCDAPTEKIDMHEVDTIADSKEQNDDFVIEGIEVAHQKKETKMKEKTHYHAEEKLNSDGVVKEQNKDETSEEKNYESKFKKIWNGVKRAKAELKTKAARALPTEVNCFKGQSESQAPLVEHCEARSIGSMRSTSTRSSNHDKCPNVEPEKTSCQQTCYIDFKNPICSHFGSKSQATYAGFFRGSDKILAVSIFSNAEEFEVLVKAMRRFWRDSTNRSEEEKLTNVLYYHGKYEKEETYYLVTEHCNFSIDIMGNVSEQLVNVIGWQANEKKVIDSKETIENIFDEITLRGDNVMNIQQKKYNIAAQLWSAGCIAQCYLKDLKLIAILVIGKDEDHLQIRIVVAEPEVNDKWTEMATKSTQDGFTMSRAPPNIQITATDSIVKETTSIGIIEAMEGPVTIENRTKKDSIPEIKEEVFVGYNDENMRKLLPQPCKMTYESWHYQVSDEKNSHIVPQPPSDNKIETVSTECMSITVLEPSVENPEHEKTSQDQSVLQNAETEQKKAFDTVELIPEQFLFQVYILKLVFDIIDLSKVKQFEDIKDCIFTKCKMAGMSVRKGYLDKNTEQFIQENPSTNYGVNVQIQNSDMSGNVVGVIDAGVKLPGASDAERVTVQDLPENLQEFKGIYVGGNQITYMDGKPVDASASALNPNPSSDATVESPVESNETVSFARFSNFLKQILFRLKRGQLVHIICGILAFILGVAHAAKDPNGPDGLNTAGIYVSVIFVITGFCSRKDSMMNLVGYIMINILLTFPISIMLLSFSVIKIFGTTKALPELLTTVAIVEMINCIFSIVMTLVELCCSKNRQCCTGSTGVREGNELLVVYVPMDNRGQMWTDPRGQMMSCPWYTNVPLAQAFTSDGKNFKQLTSNLLNPWQHVAGSIPTYGILDNLNFGV